jgi:chromosome segregation ATPase
MLQKIMELISVLDQRKDESIERTFKGVARHFREVFSELVQGGHGYLVMMKKKVRPHPPPRPAPSSFGWNCSDVLFYSGCSLMQWQSPIICNDVYNYE